MALATHNTTLSRRDEIMAAARKLFLQSGYASTSVDAVAQAAGVSKPTVYKYFANKEKLFEEIVLGQADAVTFRINSATFPKDDPVLALQAYGTVFLDAMLEPDTIALTRIMIMEGPQFPEIDRVFQQSACNPVADRLSQLMAELKNRGHLTCPDTERACSYFYGLLLQPTLWRVLLGRIDIPATPLRQEVVAEAVQIFGKFFFAK